MGKFVGTIHEHDMPALSGDVWGKVWECSCGGMFFASKMTGTWLPVDKKVHTVTLDTEE